MAFETSGSNQEPSSSNAAEQPRHSGLIGPDGKPTEVPGTKHYSETDLPDAVANQGWIPKDTISNPGGLDNYVNTEVPASIPEHLGEGVGSVTPTETDEARAQVEANRKAAAATTPEATPSSPRKKGFMIGGIAVVAALAAVFGVKAATSGSSEAGPTNTEPTATAPVVPGTVAPETVAPTPIEASTPVAITSPEVATPAPTSTVETAPVAGEVMSAAEVTRLDAMTPEEFLANTTLGQRVAYGAAKVAENQATTLKESNESLTYYGGDPITLPVAASPNNTGQEIYDQSMFTYATMTGLMDKKTYVNDVPGMIKIASSYAMEGNTAYTNTLAKLDLKTALTVNAAKVVSESEVATATSGNQVKKVQYELLDNRLPSDKKFYEETYEFVPFDAANPNEGKWVIVFSQGFSSPIPPLAIVNN